MNPIVESNLTSISNLCKKHKVDKLYAFGSVISNKFSQNSDVDLLVRFSGIDLNEYADNYFDLKFSLEDLLHRQVDLLEEQAISNPYLLKSINSTKKLIYG